MTPTPEALAKAIKIRERVLAEIAVRIVQTPKSGLKLGIDMPGHVWIEFIALALTEQAREIERATWEAAAPYLKHWLMCKAYLSVGIQSCTCGLDKARAAAQERG